MRNAPSPDEILDALDPEQREVASTLNGPMCVLAGAGTGKTRAITHRIAYGVRSGVYTPQQVLAVTFTARAAGEMRTRLRQLGVTGVQARTFHAAALRQLQYFWPQAVGGALPPLVDHKARLVAEAASRLRLQVDRAAVRDLAAEIEWAKVSMLTPDLYPMAITHKQRLPPTGFDAATVGRLLRTYEELKNDRSVIDFEDCLLLLVGILQDNEKIAATVRSQYRHFVVDEYQDVSGLQQTLVDCWLGPREELCVVGDASQTIYSFAGATPTHLLGFKKRFPDAHVVKLVRDYRSSPQIVAMANALLDQAPPAMVRGRVELVSQAQPGPAPEFTEYTDDVDEAEGIARALTRITAEGTAPAEIAVLFRTNGQSQAFEQALASVGVPYVLRGAERFFARREVREAVVALRGSVRSDDGSTPLPSSVRDILAAVGWSETAPEVTGAVRERWESLQALVSLADELEENLSDASLAAFVAELDERAAAQHAPTVQGVTLASLHAAKGLEWDVVALAGMSEGLLPISYATTPENIEEERRLLYVGVTRARRRLLVSWASARSVGGRASRVPSRFLDGIRPDSTPTPGAGRRTKQPRSAKKDRLPRVCRVCSQPLASTGERKVGRCATCPPSYDEALFEALREWRRGVAEETGAPAFVVFTDSTLVSIAESRPTSAAALATISGVGPTKLERYGADVLRIVTESE